MQAYPIMKDIKDRPNGHIPVRVMVATNALGMGINKPDVRTVLHLYLPQTLKLIIKKQEGQVEMA